MKFKALLALLCFAPISLCGGFAEAKTMPTSMLVCIDSATGVVSRVATGVDCAGSVQKWSALQPAPNLCWDASSLVPKSRSRLVTLAGSNGCVPPFKSIPIEKLTLLCADKQNGELHWPVTRRCDIGNIDTWVRVGMVRPASSSSTAVEQSSPSTTVEQLPLVSLNAITIRGNTWPKAVVVSANVAGTVYLVEGNLAVNSVSDITSASSSRWTSGAVTDSGVPTSIAIDADSLLNGYYRVYLVTARGVISPPASNLVTISVTRAYETAVTVQTQTLDQSSLAYGNGCYSMGPNVQERYGQLFTPGLSGPLSKVSIGINATGTVTNITASIYASNGLGATGPVLASETITGATIPAYNGCNSASPTPIVHFNFASPAVVAAGSRYIVVLSTTDVYCLMMCFGPTGGQFNINQALAVTSGAVYQPLAVLPDTPTAQNFGFVFATYVDV